MVTGAEESKKITVLIVDDHPLMRIGVRATVNAQDDMRIIAEAKSGEEAIDACLQHVPNIVIMDLGLPDMSGMEAIQRIRSQESFPKILALTMYEGDENIFQALRSGADGYVLKGMAHEVMLSAIRTVHRGERFLPPSIAKNLAQRNPDMELRPREKQVLTLIVAGKSNKEIASELGISERTVKCHVSAIFLRMRVTDRTQAAMAALQRGIVRL